MKTASDLPSEAVDSVESGNESGRTPSAYLARILPKVQPNPSVLRKMGKSLPVAHTKGLEDGIGLTTPASPVRDRTSTRGRIRRGKWGLHALAR